MKNDQIIIFDTTLRDSEQCPGASFLPFKRTLFQGATIRFCSSTSAML
jgi:hypothetical protein